MIQKAVVGILILAGVMASVSSCGGPEGVSRHVRDHKAYALGQEYGRKVVDLRDDEPSVQDALLDVRARITNIHDRLGAQASTDYERGFVDYIKANDDSLARVLF